MKYQSKSATKYMFRNFWQLAPLGLVAAALLGMFLNTNAEIQLVLDLHAQKVTTQNMVDSILNAISVLRFGKFWWGLLLSVAALAFTESLFMVKVERHMRVGEMNFFPLKRAFATFPAVLAFVLGVIVCMELFNLIIAGIAFLLRSANPTLLCIISLVLVYLSRAAVAMLSGALMLAFPIMFVENYSFTNALSYSVRLMSEKRGYLWFFGLAYPLLRFALSTVCLFVNNYAVTVVLFSLLYLLLAMFLPCITFKMYYDTVGGERRDIVAPYRHR